MHTAQAGFALLSCRPVLAALWGGGGHARGGGGSEVQRLVPSPAALLLLLLAAASYFFSLKMNRLVIFLASPTGMRPSATGV
jgi:hypothetical protein